MFHGPLKSTIFVHLEAAPGIRFGATFQPCEQLKTVQLLSVIIVIIALNSLNAE
jgi:hypothetical protein